MSIFEWPTNMPTPRRVSKERTHKEPDSSDHNVAHGTQTHETKEKMLLELKTQNKPSIQEKNCLIIKQENL